MKIILRLSIVDPRTGRVVRSVARARSLTNAGYEFLLRAACDPAGRPGVISRVGIGWGPGSTTPFDPGQTGLQGDGTSIRDATWIYDPATDRRQCRFRASWPAGDPVAQTILIGELGLFGSNGVMIDRTPITPTPKYGDRAAVVDAVIYLAESEVGFRLI